MLDSVRSLLNAAEISGLKKMGRREVRTKEQLSQGIIVFFLVLLGFGCSSRELLRKGEKLVAEAIPVGDIEKSEIEASRFISAADVLVDLWILGFRKSDINC